MIIYLNLCSTKGVFTAKKYNFGAFSEHVYHRINRSSTENQNVGSFLVNFQFRAEVEKVTNLKDLQLGLGSSLVVIKLRLKIFS